MTELVTGEAVVLEMRRAELASRFLSVFIDLLLQYVLIFGWVLAVAGTLSSVNEALGAAIALTGWVAIILGYPVAMETLTRGRTLGKMAMGLRVVRDDGGPIRFRHALMRGLLGIVEIWLSFGIIALLAALFSSAGKRLGDLVAGTFVVHERVPAHGGPMPDIPPGLAGWAAALDLSRLPDDLALAARQYLVRQPSLTEQARAGMGESLASAFAERVTPTPPGVPPALYLSVVLAERRRRELLRMGAATAMFQPYAGTSPAPGHPPSRTGPAPPAAGPSPQPGPATDVPPDAFAPPS